MGELIHRHRQALRLAGLGLLALGLAVTLAFSEVVGLALIGAAVVPLALVQPLILARTRSRATKKVASSNGHAPGASSEDLDVRR